MTEGIPTAEMTVAWMDINGETRKVSGIIARVLLLLVDRGAKGISPVDLPHELAHRLSNHIARLRRYGIPIQNVREPYRQTWRARYRINRDMQLRSVGPIE